MKIIAKTTNGYLVEAETKEVEEILTSVNGTKPEKIEIGQKIPAIDYASTIRKIKDLHKNYEFVRIFTNLKEFIEAANALKTAVENAKNIDG